MYSIAGKFGGLASISENKNILIWQMAKSCPESTCTLEIVEGSGLVDQSSSIKQIIWNAAYGGIGLLLLVRDYPALKRSKTIENKP